MLNSIEVRQLRVKQFVSTNLYLIAFLSLFFWSIVTLQPTRLQALATIMIFIAVNCFINLLELKGKEIRPFRWAKKLISYEKEKLGPEWYKYKRSEFYSRAILIPLLSLQLLFDHRHDPFLPNELDVGFWLVVIAVIFLFVNLHLIMRNRKIDRLTTAELQGFTKKEFGVGLFIGLFLIFVIAAFTVFFITL